MTHLDSIVVAGVFVAIGVAEAAVGAYANSKRRRDDWLIDLVSVTQLAILIKPGIVLAAGVVWAWLLPAKHGILSGLPLWLGFFLVFIPGDFLHYWYHRKGHEWGWLWRMHRTHHTTPTMGVTVAFRENWQWFAFMPDLWYGASLVYFGLGEAVVLSTLLVGVHNVLTHTHLAWDRPIYRVPALAWALERFIQLPSTHRAHHAAANPHGGIPFENYAQTLFVWDALFGTARYPRGADPKEYGIQNDPKDSWQAQIWWPVTRSKSPESVLAKRSYRHRGA